MEIDKHYELPFTPNRIFNTWVCSDTVIPPATRMDINPQVGGHYRLYMEMEDRCSRAEGLFFSVIPDRHLRYTWEWDRDGEITEVDVTLVPTAKGTALHIHHTGFVNKASRDMHDSNWDEFVEQLSAILDQESDMRIRA